MPPFTSLLAPVDLESIAWEALEYAGWMAAQSGAIADILFVQPIRPEQDQERGEFCSRLLTLLATLTNHFASKHIIKSGNGAAFEPIFVGNIQPGDPAELIMEFAERRQHDVIILGSQHQAHTSIVGHGLVAEEVLHNSNRPVLIVPPRPRIDAPRPSLSLI